MSSKLDGNLTREPANSIEIWRSAKQRKQLLQCEYTIHGRIQHANDVLVTKRHLLLLLGSGKLFDLFHGILLGPGGVPKHKGEGGGGGAGGQVDRGGGGGGAAAHSLLLERPRRFAEPSAQRRCHRRAVVGVVREGDFIALFRRQKRRLFQYQ